MRSLRDAAAELEKLGAVIVGVSVDSPKAQKEFCEQQKLPFNLLADEEGKLAKLFGVFDQKRKLARRVTFVIDPQGVIRAVDEKVNVRTHGHDIAKLLRELQDKEKG